MSAAPGLILLGFGGHARSVADVALAAGYSELIFVDAAAREGESFLNFPVMTATPSGNWLYMPCAGNNHLRVIQLEELQEAGHPIATIVSPRATIGAAAVLGPGCFVGHHAHVGPNANISGGCVVNTSSIVEHDCRVGKGTHVSIRSAVAGYVGLGDRVFLGAGSVVIDRLTIASDVTIGAGGVVIESIETAGTYVGVPVRRVGK